MVTYLKIFNLILWIVSALVLGLIIGGPISIYNTFTFNDQTDIATFEDRPYVMVYKWLWGNKFYQEFGHYWSMLASSHVIFAVLSFIVVPFPSIFTLKGSLTHRRIGMLFCIFFALLWCFGAIASIIMISQRGWHPCAYIIENETEKTSYHFSTFLYFSFASIFMAELLCHGMAARMLTRSNPKKFNSNSISNSKLQGRLSTYNNANNDSNGNEINTATTTGNDNHSDNANTESGDQTGRDHETAGTDVGDPQQQSQHEHSMRYQKKVAHSQVFKPNMRAYHVFLLRFLSLSSFWAYILRLLIMLGLILYFKILKIKEMACGKHINDIGAFYIQLGLFVFESFLLLISKTNLDFINLANKVYLHPEEKEKNEDQDKNKIEDKNKHRVAKISSIYWRQQHGRCLLILSGFTVWTMLANLGFKILPILTPISAVILALSVVIYWHRLDSHVIRLKRKKALDTIYSNAISHNLQSSYAAEATDGFDFNVDFACDNNKQLTSDKIEIIGDGQLQLQPQHKQQDDNCNVNANVKDSGGDTISTLASVKLETRTSSEMFEHFKSKASQMSVSISTNLKVELTSGPSSIPIYQ